MSIMRRYSLSNNMTQFIYNSNNTVIYTILLNYNKNWQKIIFQKYIEYSATIMNVIIINEMPFVMYICRWDDAVTTDHKMRHK